MRSRCHTLLQHQNETADGVCRGLSWAAGSAAARSPGGVAGPSTPAGIPTAAFRLVCCPQVEDSLNESLPLYGGDPNILILRTTGHKIQA